MTKREKELMKRIDELENALLDLYAWSDDFSSVDIRCRIEECISDAAELTQEEDDDDEG